MEVVLVTYKRVWITPSMGKILVFSERDLGDCCLNEVYSRRNTWITLEIYEKSLPVSLPSR